MEMNPCSTLQVLRSENDGDKEACPLLRIFPEHIAEKDNNILFAFAWSCRLILVFHIHSTPRFKVENLEKIKKKGNYVSL